MTYTTYSHKRKIGNRFPRKTLIASSIAAIITVGLFLSVSSGSSQASERDGNFYASSQTETTPPSEHTENDLLIGLCLRTAVTFSGTTALNCSNNQAEVHYEYFDTPESALSIVSQYSLTPHNSDTTFIRYGESDTYHRLMIVDTSTLSLVNIQSEVFTDKELLTWWETAIEEDSLN